MNKNRGIKINKRREKEEKLYYSHQGVISITIRVLFIGKYNGSIDEPMTWANTKWTSTKIFITHHIILKACNPIVH
jgi:hypothetical protein